MYKSSKIEYNIYIRLRKTIMTRAYTNHILEIINNVEADPEVILKELMLWLSEDEVKEFYLNSFMNTYNVEDSLYA